MRRTCSVDLTGDVRFDFGGELLAALACDIGWVAVVRYYLSILDGSELNSSSIRRRAVAGGLVVSL